MQVEVAHGNIPIFRHDQVQSNHARILGSQFEAGENLREHLLRQQPAQYLIQVANSNITSWGGRGRATRQLFLLNLFFFVEFAASAGDLIFQTAGHKLLAHAGEVGIPTNFRSQHCRAHTADCVHQFNILQVVCAGLV